MRKNHRSIRMIRHAVLAFVAVGVSVSSIVAQGAPPDEPPGQRDAFGGYASTHIVVRFKSDAAEPEVRMRPRVATMNARWNVSRVQRAHGRPFRNAALAAQLGLDRSYVVEVPPGTDTAAMAAAYAQLDEVEFAEVDGIGGVAQVIPDDPNFDLLYGLHNTGQTGGTFGADIDAPEAWSIHTGAEGTITVAVIDSGVDPHPEFADRMVLGINTNDPANPDMTTDDCPHGTHVAGIIAARGNNGDGIAGVSWGALIMPVRVLGGAQGCYGLESQCAEGIIWAVDNGADICNLSLQYYAGTQDLQDAVDYAHAHGVLVVGAAGNEEGGIIAYPARFANCMAVSATDDNDDLAWFSNYGNQLDVCAPGEHILSTLPGGYGYGDGTSMAASHVSGLAALIMSHRPELTNDEVRDILITTADDIGSSGWDIYFGYGRINAYSALSEGNVARIISSDPPDGAIDARQPSEVDGGEPQGWQTVELTFAGDAYQLQQADFTVTTEGAMDPAPEIVEIGVVSREIITVTLDKPVEPQAWTTITHIASGSSVRLGFLPGDVNGDGTSSPPDILALIDALNQVGQPLETWSMDIDRSNQATPSDIVREIDLLNGAGVYDSYNGATLP